MTFFWGGDFSGLFDTAMSAQPDLLSLPKTVLVIGLDSEYATLVSRNLSGWIVERAANNVSALEKIRSQAFELVVTNEETSGKDDVDLLRRIRGIHPHTRLTTY